MSPSLTLKVALGPLLLQGAYTRFNVPHLPEAEGDRSGQVGHGPTTLSVLIVGDSSAAGVGVDTQDDALAGRLAPALSTRLGGAVRWQLCARSGVTSAQARSLLTDAAPADVAVVVTGVNDVLQQVSPRNALLAREALWHDLRERAGVRHVVWTPVPPVGRFEGLPQPLRWVLGMDALAHEWALARWAQTRSDWSHLPFDLPVDDKPLMAADGFHPGPALYQLWADVLAAHIAEAVWPRL